MAPHRLRALLIAGLAAAAVLLAPASATLADSRVTTAVRALADADPELPGDHTVPVIAGIPDTLTKTATLPASSVTEPDVDVAYQWFRVDPTTSTLTLIDGASESSYTLVPADYPFKIGARAVVTKPGFAPLTLDSVAYDMSLRVPVVPGIEMPTDGFRVGNTLSLEEWEAQNDGAWHTADASYQWLRNGVAIPAATGFQYEPSPADVGKRISLRVDVSETGLLPTSFTTAPTPVIALGLIQPYDLPGVTNVGVIAPNKYLQLGADTHFDLTVPGSKMTITWLRDGKPIPKATSSLYQLTAADAGRKISIRVSMSQPGYATLTQTSISRGFTITQTGPKPVLVGEPIVGGTIYPDASVEFTRDLAPTGDSLMGMNHTYSWYRNGVAIPGAHDHDYTLQPADYGKSISFGMVASEPGYFTGSYRSPATQVIRHQLLAGYDLPASVTQSGLKLTAVAAITTPSTTYGYAWFRGSTAIPKATKASYTLTTADWGKTVWVRVIASKADFTTVVKRSDPIDYSLKQDAAPTLSASAWRVGEVVSIVSPNYLTEDGPVAMPTRSYQWYRNGVAIKGATSSTYALASADYAKRVSVRIVASAPGHVPLVVTTSRSAVIAKGVTAGDPVATISTVGTRLSASIAPGTLVPATPAPAVTYQWLRNGAAIKGATAQTYVPVAADADQMLSVRLTVTRSNFTAPVRAVVSAAAKYSVVLLSTPPRLVSIDSPPVDYTVYAIPAAGYLDSSGATISPLISYQWLRDGMPITGATADRYRLTAGDLGKNIAVRVTASSPALAPQITTTASVGPVIMAHFPEELRAAAYRDGLHGRTLAAGLFDGPHYWDPTQAVSYGPWFTTTRTYQWYRQDATTPDAPWVKITGATRRTYDLVESADYNKNISVLMTVARPGYPTWSSNVANIDPGQNWSWVVTSPAYLSDPTPEVGVETMADFPTYVDGLGNPRSINAMYCSWKWYRDRVAIPGANQQWYTPAAADRGKLLSVDVTCMNFDWLQPPWRITADARVP